MESITSLLVNMIAIIGTILTIVKFGASYIHNISTTLELMKNDVVSIKENISQVKIDISKMNEIMNYLSHHNKRLRYIIQKLKDYTIQNNVEMLTIIDTMIKLGKHMESTMDNKDFTKSFGSTFDNFQSFLTYSHLNINKESFNADFLNDEARSL